MEEKEQFAPAEIVKDGKVTRRTFVKGAGWLTITSAIGASALGCAPSKQGAEEEPLAETGPVADPEEGFTYKSACCSVNCTSRCHLRARVKDDKIYTVTPGQMPGRDDYANCCLRSIGLGTRTHDESVRVMHPMKRTGERGSGEFEQITWEQAIDEIAERMEATKAQYGPKACGFYSFTGNLSKLSWEAPTRFAGTYGATAFDIEGIMGDHGATMGMTLCFGQGRGAHDTRDYLNSKMVVLWGRNVADTHTSEFRYLVKARENGAKIVVVDPRLCSTAAIADQWIPIKAQTDPALALGMMNVIISKDLHAKDWLVANSVAPFLVRESDGALLRDGEGEDAAWMVWDTAANQAVPNTTEGVTAALSGTFEVNGEACRTAFDHLCDEVSKYTLEYTSEITGLDPEVIEAFAMDYINAQPAGIRMGQGMQRVYHSYAPFRTVATLAMVAGYIGVPGGGASHAGGTATNKPVAGYTGPVYDFTDWSDTGKKANLVPSSKVYAAAVNHDPVPIDFLWIANSNFINMSPDSNRIINEVIPAIDFIVTVDPWWTWTAKYSDIVLPACTYWEHWDLVDRSPWAMFNQPAIEPMGESKSDVEIMSLLAKKTGVEDYWSKTDEEWIRQFVGTDHPAWDGLDWDRDVVEQGSFGRSDALYDPAIVYADGTGYKTDTGKFEFYTESLVAFDEEVPTWQPPCEDPREGELAAKYPLVYIQYHDRLNVHTQHILNPALEVVQDEPLLQMNPVDAEARGIAHGDVVRVLNDRGDMKIRAFLTEGIIPGTVATQSGWTPDYFIEGCYQNLTHHTICDAEEAYSMTNSAFYDVLVEVEKA